jgi:hypothetical protein
MSKNEVITEQQANSIGVAVATVTRALTTLAEREAAEGAIAISFERIIIQRRLIEVLSQPAVEAMILYAGKDLKTFEIGNSDTTTIPDNVVIGVAKQALVKGYLLTDDAGPHFTVMPARGAGGSLLIKEAGHRHKLKQAGCTDVRVVACLVGVRPRPNSPKDQDMLIAGKASCKLQGREIVVERPRDMPFAMKTYTSDSPDKSEAQARRRLLRDLWAAVSGEFTPEAEDESEQPTVQVVDSTPPRIAEQQISPQALYDGTRSDCVAYAAGIKAEDQRLAFQSILDVIEAATDAEELRAKKDSDIVPVLRQLGVKRATGEMVVRMMEQRCAVLEATT